MIIFFPMRLDQKIEWSQKIKIKKENKKNKSKEREKVRKDKKKNLMINLMKIEINKEFKILMMKY